MFFLMGKVFRQCLLVVVGLMLMVELSAAAKKENEKTKTKKIEKSAVVSEDGEIVFPAKGLIDYNQGTFEIWFKLTYNLEDPMTEEKSFRIIPILSFYKKEDDSVYNKEKNRKPGRYNVISCYADEAEAPTINLLIEHRQSEGGSILYVSNLIDRKTKGLGIKVPNAYVVKGLTFKADEWHFIAISWKKTENEQYECSMSIDGEAHPPITASACKIADMDLSDVLIRIGSIEDALFAVNSFRISKIVRSEEQIKSSFEKGLSADSDTLFFQNGESLAKLKKGTRLGTEVDKKGEIFGANKFIDGKFGKALLLHVPGKK